MGPCSVERIGSVYVTMTGMVLRVVVNVTNMKQLLEQGNINLIDVVHVVLWVQWWIVSLTYMYFLEY